MAIDHFTLADFQNALPSSAKSLGLVDGEETFRIPAGAAFIEVRSSIGADGKSASVGEDSIRAWLVNGDGESLGAKLQKYITRVPGWQRRLRDTLEELYALIYRAGQCNKCGEPKRIQMSHSPKNPDRMFAKCWDCDYGFVWIDEKPFPLFPLYSETNNDTKENKNEKGAEGLLLVSESGGTVGQTSGNGRARAEAVGGQRSEPAPKYLRFGKRNYAGLQSRVNEQKSQVASSADSTSGVSASVVQVSESRGPSLLGLQTDGESAESDGVQEVLGGLRFGRRVNLEAEPDEPESIVTVPQPVQFVERKPNAEQQAVIDLPANCAARVLAGPGSGKCLAPGTPILLFSGDVIPVEKVEVGMQLMGPDSRPRTVKGLAHGYDPMYKITPIKGDSYVVNAPHILSLVYNGDRYGGDGTILNISVTDYLALPKRRRHHLKSYRVGVEFPHKDVLLDPYFVGLWLGDGLHTCPIVTNTDSEVVSYLEGLAEKYNLRVTVQGEINYRLAAVRYVRGSNPIKSLMKRYSLIRNKHIPIDYKINDRNIRLSVLAGLIDSDGYLGCGYYEIIQSRKRLADDILFLARSLGFAAYMSIKVIDGKDYYRMTISGDVDEIPVLIARKKASPRKQIKSVNRTGISVQSIGVGEYYGFEIDGDGLFLLGDFTVTHNTFLIEHRIKKLLSEGVNPAKILVVTLTNTMAASMGQRIVKLNPQMESYSDHICTIHAACNRMLKDEFGPRQVAKPWQARKVLEQLAKELWPEGQRPGYAEIDTWIQLAKRNGLSGNEDLRFFADKLGGFHGERLHTARVKFDEYLKGNKLTTFADMLYEVDYLLAHDAAFRAKQQGKFTHIIVDEGQDTMGQAMRILATIAQPENNFMIVADTDQELFRFAGSTPEANVYEGFTERYPQGETRKLVINYRSTIEVVEAQKRLIAYNYSDKGGVYSQDYFKQLSAREDAEQGKPISFTMYETADEEACSIVNQILADHDKPEDVFIITRTRAQAAWFEGPLSRANISYLNLNGGSFWSLRHVRNVVNYVRLAHDYNCDEAFKDIYNIATNDFRVPWVDEPYSNHRYLGNAFLEACGNSWKSINRAVLQKRSWQIGVEDLQGFVYDIQVTLKEDGLVPALQYVIDKCYRKWLMHDEGLVDSDNAEGGKFEDLATMIGIASEYKTPDDFFKFVEGMQKADKAKNDKDWTGKLVILTAHKSKGLERPTVYAPGWCEGIDKTGKPFGLLPHTFSLTMPPQLGILPMNGKGRIEDELDIAFVMVSRAMNKVVLSGYRVDKRGEMRASRFVKYIMETS